jgi:hypothetical protein
MRAKLFLAGLGLTMCVLLNGCSTGTSSQNPPTPTADATVNFVVTDTPPVSITVLSFQVQITGAVLQPGNISLLPRPITVDLAQLVSDTGLLTSAVIDSGTYTSLTMSYANPQITILNNQTTSITVAGTTCSPGAVCTFSPALNQASVTISSGIFPLTVTANSTTGLNLDLSIPDLLQSDLSITLASGTSVNVSLLPEASSGTSEQAAIDDVFGTITSVSGSQVKMTTALGDALVLTSSSSTKYDYPASVCVADAASCLSVGQVVTADLSLLGSGSLPSKPASMARSAASL